MIGDVDAQNNSVAGNFFIAGCSSTLDINGKITEIKYNDILINKDDFNKVKKLINNTYEKEEEKDLANKLTIKTTDDIYYFSLNDDKLKYGGKVTENKKINKYLQSLTDKYTNMDFYTIDYMKNYEANNDEKTILLDKTSNYIVINFGEKVRNFKINEIEQANDKYSDVDLVYSSDNIDESTVIIRKSINYDIPDIRISFENKYGYLVSIIPRYNNDTDKIEFDTSFASK